MTMAIVERRISVAVLALLGAAAGALEARADCHPRKYAVYLSPGFEQGVRWGGYHVTVTGFSADHVCSGSMEDVLHKAWRHANGGNPYNFKGKVRGKDYSAKQFVTPKGRMWGIAFKSSMLTHKLTPLLRAGGFKELKSHWHVSLYSKNAQAAVSTFEHQLKDKPWRLYLVPMPGKACQTDGKGCTNDWIEIR